MVIAPLSGVWQAADYLLGNKPLPRGSRKPSSGEFKDILDEEMKKQKGGKTLCSISLESSTPTRS